MTHLDSWLQMWEDGRIGFHRGAVNEQLVQHIDTLTNCRKGLKILLPLCGKTVDLIWLAEQGHDVTGLEYSVLACEAFFKENNLEYSTAPVENLQDGTVYMSKDKKIKIYQCDFFHFSRDVAGQFDAVWDRASFIAINPEDRKKYSDVVMSVMKPNAVTLIETFQYDPSMRTGPPHFVPLEVIQEHYGKRCDIETIHGKDIVQLGPRGQLGHKHFSVAVFKLSLKQ